MSGDYLRIFYNAQEEVQRVERSLSQLRNQIYAELDEHREAINADTLELNQQTSRLDDVERKLDALTLRLEKLSLLLNKEEVPSFTPLTIEEQQVFLALYTTESQQWVCLRELALRAGVPLKVVPALLESMMYKAIPVRQEIIDDECKVCLDKEFRTLQAKNNVVLISDSAKASTQMRQHVTLDRFSAF